MKKCSQQRSFYKSMTYEMMNIKSKKRKRRRRRKRNAK